METVTINEKEYTIDVEKCKKEGFLREKETNLPKTWNEYTKTKKLRDTYYYVEGDGNKILEHSNPFCNSFSNFNTEREAEAFMALGQLIQLRDAWIGDWTPDKDAFSDAFSITRMTNKETGDIIIEAFDTWGNDYLFTFPTREMRDDFLETFSDLFERAKIFI